MHICCANCAVYPIHHLRERGIEFGGLWFNPNIHPVEEYGLRKEALRELQSLWGLDIDFAGDYGLDEFMQAVDSHAGDRCEACFRMRMGETARRASSEGFDAFSTSLLVSPWQNHGLIAEAGREAQEAHDVEFYYKDLRPGYREARREARTMGLYSQWYCGCVFSRKERELEKAEKAARKASAGGAEA